jgi:hypothetical protein
MPLRGVEFMSELKLRPTRRVAGASRRLFISRAGLSYAAPPFDAAGGRASRGRIVPSGARATRKHAAKAPRKVWRFAPSFFPTASALG